MKSEAKPPFDKKDILQGMISLFEGEFSIDWVMELAGLKASEVISFLEELAKKGWTKRIGRGFYLFSNSAVRRNIQKDIPDEDKLLYHRLIADILISESADSEQAFKELHYHLLPVQCDELYCSWLKKVGDNFLKSFHIEKAFECYSKVLNDIINFDSVEANAIFIDTAIKYSKISIASQETPKMLNILELALSKAESSDQFLGKKALLHMHMAKYEWFRTNYRNSIKHFEKATLISKDLNDGNLLLKISIFNVFFKFWQGRYKEVVADYEKCVPEITIFPEGRFSLLAIDLAAHCYFQTGHVSHGLGLLDALRKHSETKGDVFVESYAVLNIGLLMLDLGRIDEAYEYLEYSVNLASQVCNGWVNILGKLGMSYSKYLKDERNEAVELLKEFLSLRSQYQVLVWPFPYFLELCWAVENGGLPDIPGLSLKEEIDNILKTDNLFIKGLGFRYKARLERKKGAPEGNICKFFNSSLKCLASCGSLIEKAKTQLEMAQHYLVSGREGHAKKNADEAFEILSSYDRNIFPDSLKHLLWEETSRREHLLEEIFKLANEITSIRDTKELIQNIISAVIQLTRAERGAIFTYQEGRFTLRASKNLTSSEFENPEFSSSLKIIRDVYRSRKGCITRFQAIKDSKLPYSSKNIRSAICVPMIIREEVTGVLYVDNRFLSSAFDDADLTLLSYFAAQVSIAFDNMMAHEQIQLTSERLREEKRYIEAQSSETNGHIIVGESSVIRKLMNRVKQVAKTDTTVIITGETGVGKELVAYAIHSNSSRKDKPLISIQCSALAESLFPSEMFGHEKGAYTGALQRRIGRLEMANGGTLFLDEIGDLPVDMQINLLRVLQTRSFERIGGNETIHSDFRLIAATNKNLEDEVKKGRFRKDLYYRINVFSIHVPPLKDRKDDIPVLVSHFIQKNSKKFGKAFRMMQEDLEFLMKHDWPGNIRELEHVIEKAAVISNGSKLLIREIMPTISTSDDQGLSSEEIKFSSLDDNERRHIMSALEKTKGKIYGKNGAAELLKINPSTLVFRIKKLGIPRAKPKFNKQARHIRL
jgi:transcriptional regulator with GAF, ATPase, and Fis domain/tetratricopeptide (TPR) repeat protein